MAEGESPKWTPKRKRGEDTSLIPVKFNFDLSKTAAADDGNGSPRSQVAHKFLGLDIAQSDSKDAAYTTAKFQLGDEDDTTRKRQRSDAATEPIPEPSPTPIRDTTEGSLHHTYPSINRLSQSQPQPHKLSLIHI